MNTGFTNSTSTVLRIFAFAPEMKSFPTFLISLCILVFPGIVSMGSAFGQTPLKDAVALWHMNDASDSSDQSGGLDVRGNIKPGVPLSPEEAAESRKRGGDGKAAKIEQGGFFMAGQGTDGKFHFENDAVSVYLRLRVPSGRWSFPIFAKHGGADKLAYNLYSLNDTIGFEVGTDRVREFVSATFHASDFLPNASEGPKVWHDIIGRYNGVKVELFIDGRCVDENFLSGRIRRSDEPLCLGAESYGGNPKSGFEGLIDHAAIWDRALTDDEILFLSGGKESADLRGRAGPVRENSVQYWIPGEPYAVGDAMPFFDEKEGVFHLPYLLYRKDGRSPQGAEWHEMVSSDLVHWTSRPPMLSISHPWEVSLRGGSVLRHDNRSYLFYTTLPNKDREAPDGKRYENAVICLATSGDGLRFEKQSAPLIVLPKSDGYTYDVRSPFVFQSDEDGLFHLVASTYYRGDGHWVHAVSKDLTSWKLLDPIPSFGNITGPTECFRWGDRYYLISGRDRNFYRVSETLSGLWESPDRENPLMSGTVRSPRSAAFKGGRRILYGWIGGEPHDGTVFAGIPVFHELVRRPDGSLGEKFVPEMIPGVKEPIVSEKNISGTKKEYDNIPGNLRLRCDFRFDPETTSPDDELRLFFHENDPRFDLRLAPFEKAVYLGKTRMEGVDFSSGSLHVDIIVKDKVIDLCVNDESTVTKILPAVERRRIRLDSPRKTFGVTRLEIAPLK